MSLSGLLARYVAATRFQRLPAPVVEMAKITFLDWLGNTLVGATRPEGEKAIAVARRLGQGSEAQMVVAGGVARASAYAAAFAGGACSHIIELDDVYKTSTLHPGTAVIPAALAAAQRERASGRRLIEAIVVGFDVAIRVGEAVNPSHYRHWHSTATCGTFGAAAAAVWQFLSDGAMSKHLHSAKSNLNGLLSADLAQAGYTGARLILEGEKGFARATGSQLDAAWIEDRLGSHYKILENWFKVHACCGHTHTAIDVAIGLSPRLSASAVRRISVGTYRAGYELVHNGDPRTPYEAKFSLPYTVAAGLLWRRAGLSDFSPDKIFDPQARALMQKVSVHVDPDIDRRYPAEWGAHLRIELESGEVIEGRAAQPRGCPDNPATAAELEQKFRQLAGLVLPPAGVERLVAAVQIMEDIDDVSNQLEV